MKSGILDDAAEIGFLRILMDAGKVIVNGLTN
jgi:hypothetical protein